MKFSWNLISQNMFGNLQYLIQVGSRLSFNIFCNKRIITNPDETKGKKVRTTECAEDIIQNANYIQKIPEVPPQFSDNLPFPH